MATDSDIISALNNLTQKLDKIIDSGSLNPSNKSNFDDLLNYLKDGSPNRYRGQGGYNSTNSTIDALFRGIDESRQKKLDKLFKQYEQRIKEDLEKYNNLSDNDKKKYKNFDDYIDKDGNKDSKEWLNQKRSNQTKSEINQKKVNGKIGKAVGAIANVAKEVVNIIVAWQELSIELERASLTYRNKIIQANLTKNGQIISQGMKSITSGFTKNANDMSFEFTQASYDLASTSIKTAMDLKIAGMTYAKDVKQANLNFVNSLSGSLVAIGASIGTLIAPGIGTAVGAIIGAIGSVVTKFMGLDIKRMQLEIEKQELVKNTMDSFMERFKAIVQPWDDLVKQTTDYVLKLDDASKKFSVGIGFYGQFGETISNAMVKMANQKLVDGKNLAQIFGDEVEKIPEYMDSFMTESGRNVGLSVNDLGNIMSTGRLFGMSGGEAANLYGSMNVFNTSISSASDSMGTMYHTMAKMGLSGKKFSKELLNNLKLAQKYNFRGGVEGMMKMTQWAQQTRFNLSSATSFAEKFLSSALSDALETSAKLQVLGGSAAMYSDPLGMLYDAGADVGNLAKRQAAMFNDLTGTFNRKTGETEFSWYENYMIRQRAQAAGMNPEDVFNMIRQNNKQGVINKQLKGYGLDKETKTAIGNRATYNKKLGRWEVTDINGETHDIKDYATGKESIANLMPAETDEAILKVAQESLSHLQNLDYAVTGNKIKLGEEKRTNIVNTVGDKLNTYNEFYNGDWNKISKGWDAANTYTLKAFEENIKIMKTTANNVDMLEDIYNGYLKIMEEMTDGEYISEMKKAASEFTKGTDNFRKYTEMILGITENGNEQQVETPLNPNNRIPNNNNNGKVYSPITRMYNDGVGNTNGGVILGASNIRSINDGSVSVRTASSDQYLAAMPNGPIDKILQQLIPGMQAIIQHYNSNNNNMDVSFNGKIDLSQNGSTVNLVELIRDDPSMASQFIKLLQRAMETNKSGKPSTNYIV